MKCIIPCAGESRRMFYTPKQSLLVGGKPLLTHVIDAWKDSVDGFVFVLKRSSAHLWEYLPSNSIVVFQDEPKGLAHAILQAEGCVQGRFIIALGDCLHRGKFESKDFGLGIGVWRTGNLVEVNKSYSVETTRGFVTRVIEKPNVHPADTSGPLDCGMGVYFFDSRIFDYIRKTKITPGGGDFTEVIQKMIDAGEKVTPIRFEGDYINVTYPEDIKKAEEILK